MNKGGGGTQTMGSAYRSVATVVKSSKEDYIKWKEGREQMDTEERNIDERILVHKERWSKLGNELERKLELGQNTKIF